MGGGGGGGVEAGKRTPPPRGLGVRKVAEAPHDVRPLRVAHRCVPPHSRTAAIPCPQPRRTRRAACHACTRCEMGGSAPAPRSAGSWLKLPLGAGDWWVVLRNTGVGCWWPAPARPAPGAPQRTSERRVANGRKPRSCHHTRGVATTPGGVATTPGGGATTPGGVATTPGGLPPHQGELPLHRGGCHHTEDARGAV
jgi:hypothetical protein